MSAMRSASSRTRAVTSATESSPRSPRSMRRPGVAIRMSTPWRSALICGSIDVPPYTAATRTPTALPRSEMTSHTCTASSRVGTSTSERGRFGAARSAVCNSGRPNASVLPDPVLAFPHTSRPARASAMVIAWIGNGSLIERSARAATNSGASPRASKVVVMQCESCDTVPAPQCHRGGVQASLQASPGHPVPSISRGERGAAGGE